MFPHLLLSLKTIQHWNCGEWMLFFTMIIKSLCVVFCLWFYDSIEMSAFCVHAKNTHFVTCLPDRSDISKFRNLVLFVPFPRVLTLASCRHLHALRELVGKSEVTQSVM